MLDIYRDLAWLERPPEDFRTRVRALAKGEGDGAAARRLAACALDFNQLTQLGRAIAAMAPAALKPLVPLTIGILGNGTLDFLAEPLIGAAARYGFALKVVRGAYGQILQDALSPVSEVNAARPDFVLLGLDWRGLPFRPSPGDAAAAEVEADRCLAYVDQVRAGVLANSGAVCIVPTFAPPAEPLFGSFDRALPGTTRYILDALNRRLAESLAASPDLMLDVASLAETVGLGAWYDPAQWNMAKLPFAGDLTPLYADHVLRLVAAARGKSRRVLVMDLDNTLWGGVVGDDGMAGILLAQGDATGEAHLAVQQMALALRARGVVLAVCSKNDDAVAREVFTSHHEMLLRPEHIAVFQANWNDKATNIKAIADELALGLDSIVFIDDNPVERALVRRTLPEVAVPELGEDPALYARTLAAAGYFELTTFSAEDRARADLYQVNAKRVALRNQVADLDAYLQSLDMEIVFSPFDEKGRARIAQLINKSNQFNLTTRRYTEAEVQALSVDPEAATLQVRLKDVFADNGMISVVVCRAAGDKTWEIDTWLMSCRVLGRGVERMVLREIQHEAKKRGIETLIGVYLPTQRNGMVADHYPKLGFAPAGERADGGTAWSLAVDAEVEGAPMAVVRLEAGPQAADAPILEQAVA